MGMMLLAARAAWGTQVSFTVNDAGSNSVAQGFTVSPLALTTLQQVGGGAAIARAVTTNMPTVLNLLPGDWTLRLQGNFPSVTLKVFDTNVLVNWWDLASPRLPTYFYTNTLGTISQRVLAGSNVVMVVNNAGTLMESVTISATGGGTFVAAIPVAGDYVVLEWEPVLASTITNYAVSWGVSSGVYTNQISTGTNTEAIVSNLASATKYYFTVQATDTNGLTSAYGSEVSCYAIAPPNMLTSDQVDARVTVIGDTNYLALGGTNDFAEGLMSYSDSDVFNATNALHAWDVANFLGLHARADAAAAAPVTTNAPQSGSIPYSIMGSTNFTASTNLRLNQTNLVAGIDNLGTMIVPSLVTTNSKSAATNAQQVSPAIMMYGQGERTGNNTSMPVAMGIYTVPVQGTATNPLGELTFAASISNAAPTYVAKLSSDGFFTIGSLSASAVLQYYSLIMNRWSGVSGTVAVGNPFINQSIYFGGMGGTVLFGNGSASASMLSAAYGFYAETNGGFGIGQVLWGTNANGCLLRLTNYNNAATILMIDGTAGTNLFNISSNGTITASRSIAATNGYVFPQLQFLPTNSIPVSSAGITNWMQCNVSNYAIGTYFATNYLGPAGSFLKSVFGTVSTYP
jgi:hypothetical protein